MATLFGGMLRALQFKRSAPFGFLSRVIDNVVSGVNVWFANQQLDRDHPHDNRTSGPSDFDNIGSILTQLIGGVSQAFGGLQNAGGQGSAGEELRRFAFGQVNSIISQIMAQQNRHYGPAPPASRAIRRLPPLARSQVIELAIAGNECAICQDSIAERDTITQLPCRHAYHSDCISPWLARANTCPVCRYPLETDDPYYERVRQSILARRNVATTLHPTNLSAPRTAQVDGQNAVDSASDGIYYNGSGDDVVND